MSAEEVKKVCHDYTVNGLSSMAAVANPDHPFRFIYTSGVMSERDQDNKGLWLIPEYRKMRVSFISPSKQQIHTLTCESGAVGQRRERSLF